MCGLSRRVVTTLFTVQLLLTRQNHRRALSSDPLLPDDFQDQMALSSDLSRQYISSLSILVVALFVGVPIWWKTTEVYRCALPYREIEELKHQHVS